MTGIRSAIGSGVGVGDAVAEAVAVADGTEVADGDGRKGVGLAVEAGTAAGGDPQAHNPPQISAAAAAERKSARPRGLNNPPRWNRRIGNSVERDANGKILAMPGLYPKEILQNDGMPLLCRPR
ncbi:MAG: hypothetical protein JW929_16360 [Anaerolineales bacterium]|nr:hypothetical protein [Anaerolineales bacterium]